MSKAKKGYSQDEKCQMMVDFLVEKMQPYTLKELENIVPKVKQAISRIESDKMGASNFFWCFPSAAAAKRKRKREELDSELEQLNVKRQKLDEELQVVSVGKEPTEEREELLALRKELQGKKSELDAKVEKIGECDPKRIEAYKNDAEYAKDCANRWTDAIFIMEKKAKESCMDMKMFRKQFEIPEELEEME